MQTFFVPEVSKRVAARTKHKVEFVEGYGGSMVKVADTLEGVQSGIIDIGGAADGIGGLPITPKYKLLASASYEVTSKLRVLVQERWRDKLKQNGNAAVFFAAEDVKAVAYTDVNFNYKINDETTAFFNVQNLFDQAPAPFASNGGSSQPNYLGGFAQGDDLEGRYFTTGVKLRF